MEPENTPLVPRRNIDPNYYPLFGFQPLVFGGVNIKFPYPAVFPRIRILLPMGLDLDIEQRLSVKSQGEPLAFLGVFEDPKMSQGVFFVEDP